MTLNVILIFICISIIGNFIKRRAYGLMTISIAVLYWMQPDLPFIVHEFWLPTFTLALITLCWAVISVKDQRSNPENIRTALILFSEILLIDLLLMFQSKFQLQLFDATNLGYLAIFSGMILLLSWFIIMTPNKGILLSWLLITSIIAIFILLKLPLASNTISKFLVELAIRSGVEVTSKIPPVLSWFGYSYIAFRLIHTIRDHQAGKTSDSTLAEYITYIIFFPTLSAGPIDRIERFIKELRHPLILDSQGWLDAGQRITLGLFKKFFIANSLAMFTLDSANISYIRSAGGMWLYVYTYALVIFFDFSGYTDIVIGLGRLLGFKIPENFSSPYLQSNITKFWNNWHMTLTQWFRAYFFNPLTRELRSQKRELPAWLLILITQLTTMTLIGLWHGIALNYVLWGVWHGIGLFIQNRWSERYGRSINLWADTFPKQQVIYISSVVLTFHFVAFGWIFFALSDLNDITTVFSKLFGAG